MATYTFNPVPAYGQVGSFARIGAKKSATFPVTKPDTTSATVVQGGVTKVGYVESDAAGLIPAFTTTDIPSVVINLGIGLVTVHSLEAISAGAASAASAAASATAAAAARDSTIAGLASKEPAITAGTTAQFWRGDKSWQTLNKAAVGLGSVDNTADTAKPVSTAQAAAIAAKLDATAGAPLGVTGRSYFLVGGTIRNTGSGWAFINDANHRPSNLVTISQSSTGITVDYAATGSKVVSLMAVPDETFASTGLRVGASVGLGNSVISLYAEPADRISDYVEYNGSAWTSANGVFTGLSYNGAGVLTLTHESIGTAKHSGIALTDRGTAHAEAGALTDTTAQVVFYTGSFGSLTATTTANTNQHKVYVTRYGRRASVPAADPSTVVSALGNIWIIGLVEV